jgi:hypothetical protein
MHATTKFLTIVTVVSVALVGCGGEEVEEPAFGGAADVAPAEQLWQGMSGYESWSLMPGTTDFEPSSAPHGAFAPVFVNGDFAEHYVYKNCRGRCAPALSGAVAVAWKRRSDTVPAHL